MCDVVTNRLFQFSPATEHAVADAVLSDVAEPVLATASRAPVPPRTAGRSEVVVKSPMAFQPLQHVVMRVRGVVVDRQLQVQWRHGLELLQKLDPFLMPMLWQALGDDLALRQFDGGKQGRYAIACVVVRQWFPSAGEEGQALLHPVEGLNLTLLMAGQHPRVLGRVEVQPDDIDPPFGEP